MKSLLGKKSGVLRSGGADARKGVDILAFLFLFVGLIAVILWINYRDTAETAKENARLVAENTSLRSQLGFTADENNRLTLSLRKATENQTFVSIPFDRIFSSGQFEIPYERLSEIGEIRKRIADLLTRNSNANAVLIMGQADGAPYAGRAIGIPFDQQVLEYMRGERQTLNPYDNVTLAWARAAAVAKALKNVGVTVDLLPWSGGALYNGNLQMEYEISTESNPDKRRAGILVVNLPRK